MNNIRLITRHSPLALCQTETVRDLLLKKNANLSIIISKYSTQGDREQSGALQDIGGKNLFTRDLQKKIQPGSCAVHSLKDLSVHQQPDLMLAATLTRATVCDALVSHCGKLDQLSPGSQVGTASPRRRSQLLAYRPDLNCQLIRGNVGTRLAKLDAGKFDALLLAACGLERLGLTERITERLDTTRFVPAIGQGVIGIECLKTDYPMQTLLKTIHCEQTFTCIQAERAFNRYLGGDCFSAIAAHAQFENGQLIMRAYIGSLDGKIQLRGVLAGENPNELGVTLAKQLEAQGARNFLNLE
jgi:hydroxymethylbilane synthase